MAWDRNQFLKDVREEFEDRLDQIEIPDSCYDIDEGCWDEDKVRMIDDLDELFDKAVSNIVENETVWSHDCWDICKDVIGCDDFSSYNDLYHFPENIFQMAQAALDQLAKEELESDDIFVDWLAECDPPEDIGILKEQAEVTS